MKIRLVALIALPMLAACGDKETDDSAHEHPAFAEIQAIFDADCAGCHVGGATSGGLSLDDGYSKIVGVESSVAGVNYIEPGDPDNSYLYLKLTGGQASVGGGGDNMPQGGSLAAEDLELIEHWIIDGALE